jgi:sigma54-dependent transcription regulator
VTRPASRRPQPKASKGGNRRLTQLEAENTRLRRELADAQAALRQVEQGGADAFLARRLAELEEGRQVARGQAVEATIARSKAEAALQALQDAIGKAPGFSGWLLRRAAAKLDGR